MSLDEKRVTRGRRSPDQAQPRSSLRAAGMLAADEGPGLAQPSPRPSARWRAGEGRTGGAAGLTPVASKLASSDAPKKLN